MIVMAAVKVGAESGAPVAWLYARARLSPPTAKIACDKVIEGVDGTRSEG